MSDQDLFKTENNNEDNNNQETPENANPFKGLEEIKDKDGRQKYDSPEDAVKALSESQKYIPKLEQENEELRKQLESLNEKVENMGSVTDLLEKYTKKQEAQPSSETPAGAGLDIDKLVASEFEKREQAKIKQANFERVTSTITQLYGDKAHEVVAKKAAENGMTPEELGAMSQERPDLVLSLFSTPAQPNPNPTTPSHSYQGNTKDEYELPKPERSLMVGAKTSDVLEHFRKVVAAKNKQLNVEN